MSRENRMFDEMLKAARQRLAARDPVAIAKNANVKFSGGAFHFCSLGIPVIVRYPACEITPELPGWHGLVILHYLDLADGTPLTGEAITFAQQKNGLVRGGGFDSKAEKELSKLEFERLKSRCNALGGIEKQSGADYSVVLPFLPMYPVTLNYWLGDEDFPASGRLLLDSGGAHYLTIEDAVTVGELILEKLLP